MCFILDAFGRLNHRWTCADGVAAMTAGAGKADGVFAAIEFFQRFGGAVLVHRLDLSVTGDAAFELGGLPGLLKIIPVN